MSRINLGPVAFTVVDLTPVVNAARERCGFLVPRGEAVWQSGDTLARSITGGPRPHRLNGCAVVLH